MRIAHGFPSIDLAEARQPKPISSSYITSSIPLRKTSANTIAHPPPKNIREQNRPSPSEKHLPPKNIPLRKTSLSQDWQYVMRATGMIAYIHPWEMGWDDFGQFFDEQEHPEAGPQETTTPRPGADPFFAEETPRLPASGTLLVPGRSHIPGTAVDERDAQYVAIEMPNVSGIGHWGNSRRMHVRLPGFGPSWPTPPTVLDFATQFENQRARCGVKGGIKKSRRTKFEVTPRERASSSRREKFHTYTHF